MTFEEKCNCAEWARTNQRLLTRHHRDCERYDPEFDAAEIIDALLDGIVAWAEDADGVHDYCWAAFKNAAYFAGKPEIIKEGEK